MTTRREILTGGSAALLASAPVFHVGGSPVKSMLGAMSNQGEGESLPYAREVEYLESTGTQWIDTGVNVVTDSDRIELVYELLPATPRYKWIFGAYDSSPSYALAIGSGDSASRRTARYRQSTGYYNDSLYSGSAHILAASPTDGLNIDSTHIANFVSFSTISNIYLFAIPLNQPSGYASCTRIWSYKHWRSNVLVRDYIPVIDHDGVACMYDRVSGELFYNKGSGSFLTNEDA